MRAIIHMSTNHQKNDNPISSIVLIAKKKKAFCQ